MSDYVIMPSADYKAACDSIRAKTKKTDLIKSGDMATEIEGIKTDPTLQEKTITENGEYTADEGYDGLSKVTVDVKGSISAEPKYINFFDYDGTILYSYTKEELNAMTELPPLPEHEGLICQGWNWTLDEIKAEGKETDVGAMYITDDGATRLYLHVDVLGQQPHLYFQQTVGNGVTVDWGDGSEPQTVGGASVSNLTHTYSAVGDYVISLTPAEGCYLKLGNGAQTLVGANSNSESYRYHHMKYYKLEIGRNVTTLNSNALRVMKGLKYITIPQGVTTIGEYMFYESTSLRAIILPKGVTTVGKYITNKSAIECMVLPSGFTTIPSYFLNVCYSLKSLTIPTSVTSVGAYTIYECNGIRKIELPSGVTSIPNNIFYASAGIATVIIKGDITSFDVARFSECYGIMIFDLTGCTSVPSAGVIANKAFVSNCCEFLVPSALYDEWIAATNWCDVADRIVAV